MNTIFFDYPYTETTNTSSAKGIHIIPRYDYYPHINNEYCFCQPKLVVGCYDLWKHNSYDGRELEEQKKGH